jgi:hypothetical protein
MMGVCSSAEISTSPPPELIWSLLLQRKSKLSLSKKSFRSDMTGISEHTVGTFRLVNTFKRIHKIYEFTNMNHSKTELI